jgi:hypothetical protein
MEMSKVSATNRMPICAPEIPDERNRGNDGFSASGLFGESMRV